LDRPVNNPINLELYSKAKDKVWDNYHEYIKNDGYLSPKNFYNLLDDFILILLNHIVMDTLDSMENYVFGSICEEKNINFRYEWPFSFDLDRYLEFRAKMGLRTHGVKEEIKNNRWVNGQ
tara:strand:+ start:1771 stop:2130 length:360 start_codon:yes stop_codon:yes gene_type:complete